MLWKIILAAVAVIAAIAAKSIYDEKTYRRRLRSRMLREWGRARQEEYPPEKMERIALYYRDHTKEWDVDEITWNDLNMDEIYQELNHTQSAMGQEYLYGLLHRPLQEPEELEKRGRLIRFFSEREEERLQLQICLSVMGKMGKFSVYQYLRNVKELKAESSLVHIIQMAALLACILLCFVKPVVMILPTIILIFYNMLTYYQRKGEMDRYYHLFGYIVRTIRSCQEIAGLPVSGLEGYFETLSQNAAVFRKFCKNSWLVVGGGNMDGSLADAIMDYVRMLFHIDIIKFQSMAREVVRHEEQLLKLYETVGILDSAIAIASWREMMGSWCIPQLESGGEKCFEAEGMYHPLIREPVKNSLSECRSVLLTGSNASGKSTFIKAAAINAILAQTTYTALAERYRACYYRIYSSMALRDDIMSQESYYIVEIKSLKRIVDQAKKEGNPVLCFIDEVLRGTNTLERIAASSQILAMLAQSNALCFAATHDIELTNILKQYYSNYHFEERVEEKDVLFDYQLRPGPAMTRNAIKLLGMIGYDPQIIQKAEESVQKFLDSGQWTAVPAE